MVLCTIEGELCYANCNWNADNGKWNCNANHANDNRWNTFVARTLRGKRKRKDVAEFSLHLFENIHALHNDLKNKTYQHSKYQAFKINDPKPRDIHIFLETKMKLQLHPKKVSITTLASGVDFLGWVHFPHHRTLRTVTKKRMFKNLKKKEYVEESVQSYLGMLKHGDEHKLTSDILKKKTIKNDT